MCSTGGAVSCSLAVGVVVSVTELSAAAGQRRFWFLVQQVEEEEEIFPTEETPVDGLVGMQVSPRTTCR